MSKIAKYIKSEEDVSNKIVLPLLHALGYSATHYFANVGMITIHEGRKKKPIRADFIVRTTDTIALIIEVKKEEETHESAIEQGKSYAHNITKNNHFKNIEYVPFVLTVDNQDIFIVESKTNVRWNKPKQFKVNDMFDSKLSVDIKNLKFKELHKKVSLDSVLEWLKKEGRTPVEDEEFELEPVTDKNWNETRKIFEKCHDLIRNRYADHPTEAFHEISKILFIKMNEEHRMKKFSRRFNRFTTKAIIDANKKYNHNLVKQLFDQVKEEYEEERLFEKEDTVKLSFNHTLQIVKWLQKYQFVVENIGSDVAGRVFENFVNSTLRGKGLGQFFTPRPVVEFIICLLDPKVGEKIIDPACGSGGFLINSFVHVKDSINRMNLGDHEKEKFHRSLVHEDLFGVELNKSIARTCKMNMIVHGDGRNGVYDGFDGLLNIEGETALKFERTLDEKTITKEIKEGIFDVVVTNPPFGGAVEKGDEEFFGDDDSVFSESNKKSSDKITDPQILSKFELGKGKLRTSTEKLFIERCIKLLKPGGRLGIIVPDGILNDDGNQDVRDIIKRDTIVKAIISLPDTTFKPSGTGVNANIMYLKRKNSEKEKQGKIFMAIAEHVGFKGGVKRIREDKNDLTEKILPEWKERILKNE